MPARAAVVFGALAIAGFSAFLAFGIDDLVRCAPGSARTEYGCVTPCPPGMGRFEPGSAACVLDEPVATPVPEPPTANWLAHHDTGLAG